MTLIAWTDALSVHILEFDEHHQKLVGLINRLDAAVSAGHDHDVIHEVLTELSNYTIYHFLGEEELLARHNFPGLRAHHDEHIRLTDQVLHFREKASLGQDAVGNELLIFLREWLRHHILETDMRYSAFLNERGIH